MEGSINLANDSLGLGQMFAGSIAAITSATGTAECGSKPTCIAITETCREKNKFYNECRMKALENKHAESRLKLASDTNKNTIIWVVGIAALVIILIFVFK